MGAAVSFGLGQSASAGISGTMELGAVYGANNEFGCYVSLCLGGESDLNVNAFGNIGIWNSWDDFKGLSVMFSEGVSFPFFEVGGFSTAQVLNTEADFIGSVNSISFGLGLSPVDIGAYMCCTSVLDSDDPLTSLGAGMLSCKDQLEGRTPPDSYHHMSPTSFDLSPDAAIPGENYTQLTNHSVDQCMRACDKDTRCNSFDYFKNQNKCDLSTKSRYDTALKTDYPGNPYDHYSKSVVTYLRIPDAAIRFHNDLTLTEVSVGTCKAVCNANPLCKSFDFYKNRRICDLSYVNRHDPNVDFERNYEGDPYDHYEKQALYDGQRIANYALPSTEAAPQQLTVDHGASYERIRNAVILGHDRQFLEDITVDACMEACDGVGWCRSFDYNETQNLCWLSDKYWWDEGIGLERDFTDDTGGRYAHYARSAKRYDYRPNTLPDLSSDDAVEQIANVSPASCKTACNAHAACGSFLHLGSPINTCTLFIKDTPSGNVTLEDAPPMMHANYYERTVPYTQNAATSVSTSYDRYAGQGLPAQYQIHEYLNLTPGQCMEACDRHEVCYSFDYRPEERTCTLSDQSAITVPLLTDFEVPYDHYVKSITTYGERTQARLTDPNAEVLRNRTPDECMAACNEDSGCQSFSFRPSLFETYVCELSTLSWETAPPSFRVTGQEGSYYEKQISSYARTWTYDGGEPNYQTGSGSDMDPAVVGVTQAADNFVLGEAGARNYTLEFWGVYFPTQTLTDTDQFRVRLYADNGGLPATQWLLDLDIGAANRTATANALATGELVYHYEASLGNLQLKTNTTYWLSIVNNTVGDPDDNWGWVTSSSGSFALRTLDGSTWSEGYGYDLAFRLTGH